MRPIRALITPPAVPVVSIAACKAALGIVSASQDDVLTAAIAAMTAQLDPASGGWLGRALRPQTWELRLPGFLDRRCEHRLYREGSIALPYPKLRSIVSVAFDDNSGVAHDLTKDVDYRVLGVGGTGKQAIAPMPGGCWPTARCTAESVRIRYEAGYAPAQGNVPDELPADIIHAIFLGVRILMSNTANLFLVADRVDGIGEKKYAVTADAAAQARSVVDGLLFTHRVPG
jgi:uncharacterized phiE125 gp8 family phage protein